MKLFQSIVIAGLLIARLHALEPAEVAAVAKGFDNPSGDEQFKARMDLNCSWIATRINTDEARELVKPLSE